MDMSTITNLGPVFSFSKENSWGKNETPWVQAETKRVRLNKVVQLEGFPVYVQLVEIYLHD